MGEKYLVRTLLFVYFFEFSQFYSCVFTQFMSSNVWTQHIGSSTCIITVCARHHWCFLIVVWTIVDSMPSQAASCVVLTPAQITRITIKLCYAAECIKYKKRYEKNRGFPLDDVDLINVSNVQNKYKCIGKKKKTTKSKWHSVM